jgi:preprotein translocase subunit SecA
MEWPSQCDAEAVHVREKGGLQVIGTALHDSRRIDNQLRGRAGRQGDPGSTIFCLSMEDELMAIYCPGWASSSVWDWSGMDEDMPLYSSVVDNQLASIQANIEDFHASHRTSTYETDRIIDGQRDAIYNVRRRVLLEGQQPLRERLFRYVEWIVDDACERAGVDGLRAIENWDVDGALADLRTVFASRRDQWLNESGREMGAFPHYLPGATGDAIKTALIAGDAMPLQTPLPGLEAGPEVITAALQGVEIVDMNPLTNPAKVTDTEPEAREEEVAARVERRMEFSRGQASLEEKGRRGAFYTLVPIRPRPRGERRSLRRLPVASLRPPHFQFPPSTPFNSASDAFELHPDVAL